jgi:hypothetical protein
MEQYNETEQSDSTQDTAVECQCTGECQCGKYRCRVYYEVDANQLVNLLNDWD